MRAIPPTIGLLLCKDKDRLVAEYALKDINKPIAVADYVLTKALPEDLKGALPTIEKIEGEFIRREGAEWSRNFGPILGHCV